MRSSKRPKTCFEHTLKLQSKGRVYNDLQLARLLELKLKHAILEVDCLKLVQLLRQQDVNQSVIYPAFLFWGL